MRNHPPSRRARSRSGPAPTTAASGFLAAWQQLLGGEFCPALGKRRGCKPRVPLTQLLSAFIFHFMNGAGTLAQRSRQLFAASGARIATASWSSGDRVYVLASKLEESELKRLL